MPHSTNSTRLPRVIRSFLVARPTSRNAIANTNPTVGKWLMIMWTCGHSGGVDTSGMITVARNSL